MRIGISGPVNIAKFCKVLELDKKDYVNSIKDFSSYIAKTNNEIVIVPHEGSISHIFAEEYKKNNGKKIISIIPKQDKEFGILFLDLKLHDKIIDCKTWRNVPEEFNIASDILIVFGLGAGSMVEIAQSKWFKVNKVYIIDDFISKKLPDEVIRNLDVEYISIDNLKKKIK